jgi:sugar phosphate isomerase/epimerase
MSHNRRSFLATLGTAVAGVAIGNRALGALPTAFAPAKKLPRIGIQLYTVRRAFGADPADTIAKIAQLGYKEVEFAGYGGKTPAEIRDLLKQHGLTSPSTHLGLNVITANPQKTFDDAKIVGHEWLTVPSLPGGPKATVDDWKRIAAQFNAAAGQAKAAGLKFAFHNHNAEFRKIGDVVPLDVLIQETDPSLVSFEMDIHWVVAGGADPIAYLTRFPNRFTMVHVKDSMGAAENHRMVDVGAGTIDFKKIFVQADKNGIKHYFVEHDGPADPMASAKASYDYLSKLEF